MIAYKSALITGASSGIGRALALALAGPGVTLHLCGRNAERLQATADACAGRGATVQARVLDVADAGAVAAWVDAAGPLELVVANAGISAGTGRGVAETDAQARTIFAVNVDGVLNTVLPALNLMRRQARGAGGRRGTIAVIASMAAFTPTPGAPSYCAGKAAVDTWTVATAHGAARDGIVMTSVCPGYIRTAMTAHNRFPMPGLMEADRAAAIILRGLAAGRRRLVFPWWVGLAARLASLLPPRLSGALLGLAPGKHALPDPT
jgi:short-subunit dehydrogenase